MAENTKDNRRIIDLTVSEFLELKQSESSEIMTPEECASFIGKKLSTIYQYTSTGSIPFHKKGKSIYFLRTEIINWIKDGK